MKACISQTNNTGLRAGLELAAEIGKVNGGNSVFPQPWRAQGSIDGSLVLPTDHWHGNVKVPPNVPRWEANWEQAGMLT
jgi:hypothetical protein